MSNYTDVFGGQTLPPSEYGYQGLTITTDVTFEWPYNSAGSYTVSKLINLTASVAGLSITLPDAQQVTTGEDFLIRNMGAHAFTVKDAADVVVATVDPGQAKYFYLTDNTTSGGLYSVVTYGAGSSEVDAAALVGYGLVAIGATLNQAHDVVTDSSATISIDDTYRSKLLLFTGGNTTCNLPQASSTTDNFFFIARNGGSGVVTFDPYINETIDGAISFSIQPGESLLLFNSGTAWYTVGYGRSLVYNFTQLVKDVSAGGTITLSSVEASNKLLTFVGNPTGTVTVIVPNSVAVYYVLNSLSTVQSVTLKTSAGAGATVPQNQRVILICDSTNVFSAQSVITTTSVSLIDGTALLPALNFASKSNTGLFKSGSDNLGVSVNGTQVATFNNGGLLGNVTGNLTGNVTGNVTSTGTSSFSNVAVTGGAINNTLIGNTTPQTIRGSTIEATSGFTGNVTGNLTGNVTGNVTGAITGNVTGNVTGNLTGNVTATTGNSSFNDVTITGTLNMDSGTVGTITGLSNPINDSDAATKGYVDNVAQGLDPKASVRAATTANITLSGTQTVDGVALVAGNRVLVKNQNTASQNGIYVVAAGSWSRSTDMDVWVEFPGAYFFVEEGTTNDNTGWVCTVAAGGTVGVTDVTFEQFSGTGQINAGAGLTKTGNTLDIGTASSARIVVNADNIDLATTGVAANTYRSVTVDSYGRVTNGTNPTTISGYAITDAYTKSEIDALFGSTSSAATSAAAAALSASNALTSENNAAASATAAAASYDAFDDRYLGPKASDPTVDNDGNALLTGALYWNTGANEMRVYTGSAWVATYVPAGNYVTGAASSVDNEIALFSGTGGKTIKRATTTGLLKAISGVISAADATDVPVTPTGSIAATNVQAALAELDSEKLATSGGSLTGALNEAATLTLASAATTDIGAQNSNTISITGTTTITSLGTANAGVIRRLVFAGALTLTHNATSLILPGGINITTAAGDVAEFLSLGSGNWRCVSYQVAAGDGYRNIPQNSKSAAYTLVLDDAGKHILHPSADTTARTFTIPANSSVPYPIGTAITFVNQASAGTLTIAITTDTMRLAGAGTTGSRTLAANGVATAIKLTATEWIISGTGLT